jgi:RHS repeat-associated protein
MRLMPRQEKQTMITRRQFTKVGIGLAAFSQVARQVFAPPTEGQAPKEGADIRRVGVRIHGEYWGLNNEMIDMLSGNLCYSVPLLLAGGRGVTAHLACSYNSQMWKQDAKNHYFSGVDLGCGVGWRLHVGVIVPQISGGKVIGYLYVTGSGAEYPLTLSSSLSNTWVSLQGLFVSYDAENRCLSFPNGNFWLFDCVSGSEEPDAGVLYPTVLQDTNGNQILISYMQGAGSMQGNSSSRIVEIRDACAVNTEAGRRSYTFVYSQEPLPHLIAIASHLVGGKSYIFSYGAQQLVSPFYNTDTKSVQMLSGLQIETASQYSFAYNENGELAEAQIPAGGCLRWNYDTYSFAEGRKVREVVQRTIAQSREDAGAAYTIERDKKENNAIIHGSATLNEPNKTAQQVWAFCTDVVSSYLGMAASFEERGKNGQSVLRRTEYTWSQTTAGVPYKGSITKTLDLGTADEARRKTEIVRDIFGNVSEVRQYEYNETKTPFKIIRNTYLTDAAYLSRNIYNRLVSRTVSDGTGTDEVVKYRYDTTPVEDRPGMFEHDTENFGVSYTVRGNVTEVVRHGDVKRRLYYDTAGLRIARENRNGKRKELQPNASWELSSKINPEADTKGIIEQIKAQSWGQQWITSNRRGVPAMLTYDNENNAIQTSNKDGWKKKTLDGFRRVVSMEWGNEDETLSVAEFEYDEQGSAGKSRRSMFYRPKRETIPHAPGAKAEWIEFSYDSLGRVTNAGKSQFVYKGNSVLIINAAGGWKKIIRGANGKIQKVVAPNPQSGPDLETTYRYNRKDRLTGVTMPRLDGTQKREFLSSADDSMVTSSQAESGQSKRTFNLDGTLASRTDAKGQRVVYGYDDKMRRVSVKRYDANGQLQPAQCITYYYDTNPFDANFSRNAKDRLVAVQWGSADTAPGLMTEMYSYTVEGRREGKRLRIHGGTMDADLDLRYSFGERGRILTIGYPMSGPKLEYTYDETGRPIQLKRGTEVLVKDVMYDAVSGRIVSYKQLVPESGKYLEQSRELNSKYQVSSIMAEFEQDAKPIVDIEYEYDDVRCLSKETDRISNDVTRYEYDASGRLKRASGAGNGEWEAEYGYDGFGNRVSQKNKKGNTPETVAAQDAATNRIVSDTVKYDANGNIVKLFDMDLSFDITNRLVSIARKDKGTEQYGYNPGNLRIWKKTASGEEEIHFYGSGGRRLATYSLRRDELGNPSLSQLDNDIYFAGKLQSSGDKPVVLDRLGSVHAWIDAQSSVQKTKYYPFGEERQVTKNNRKKFGTYTRDDFSGLDYAEQRYYSSALGRFITPDPYAGSVRIGNPDTWNRYTYVNNDPINFTDPHGLYPMGGGGRRPSLLYVPQTPQPSLLMNSSPTIGMGAAYYGFNSQAQWLYNDADNDPVWLVPQILVPVWVTVALFPENAMIPDGYIDTNLSISWFLERGYINNPTHYLNYGWGWPKRKAGAGTIINNLPPC